MWLGRIPPDFWDGGRTWINDIPLHNNKYIVAMKLVDDGTWIECEDFTETSFMSGKHKARVRSIHTVREVRWKKREPKR